MKKTLEPSENESYSDDDVYNLITQEYAASLIKIHRDKKLRDLKDMMYLEIAVYGCVDETTWNAINERITEIVAATRKAT